MRSLYQIPLETAQSIQRSGDVTSLDYLDPTKGNGNPIQYIHYLKNRDDTMENYLRRVWVHTQNEPEGGGISTAYSTFGDVGPSLDPTRVNVRYTIEIPVEKIFKVRSLRDINTPELPQKFREFTEDTLTTGFVELPESETEVTFGYIPKEYVTAIVIMPAQP